MIQRLMLRDSLTGLLNRSSIDDYLQLEINKIKRLSDEVLKSLGLFLLQRLRTIDLVGRYGGEEIAMILPDTKALQALHLVIELLVTFRTLKFTHRGNEFFVTFSAGIAEFP
jgi:diguanylate cyclase (GGDEF)-like protein